ncbi:Aspartic proteinase sxa1 [Taphrina deformans PYCC 5710]|uniref:Aspartic proteinase sxa1 n=1 Tax=Taphrina deformans (strain PYCC 5710 / ATCC 11124 / CBS 356.35 / IMI 108563 / JCM 9778 / NBRC 8474) TaxID=1097556 RepID=R4X6J8_TAPDE|nr:Aspartic proteinase sxa1 [Taphrina deformans PYCC 5710]|eukprot:CCG80750.1 Aspartic proteinase sxa1 [Taphrina deformans PYCC 5710]
MLQFLYTIAGLLVATDAQYLNLPLERTTEYATSLSKRQAVNTTLTLANQGASYVANISFGTPGQIVQLILDTGSPLTWVNAANLSTYTPGSSPTSAQQAQGRTICQSYSCLNPASSSTLTVPSNTTIFDIQYVDGTSSIGRIVEDTATFQGLTDTTFQFGLVEYFYSPNGVGAALGGILGLSPPNRVISYASLPSALAATSNTAVTSAFTPQTILQQLRDAGAISSTAFSLYLSDGSTGQLTIGGVDSGRYSGPLTVLPIQSDPTSTGTDFYVNLAATGHGGTASNRITVNQLVVLDSGTTSIYIPATVVEQLAQDLQGYFVPYDSSSGLLAIPCSTSTTIDFYFSDSAVIRVPTSEILQGRLTASQARRLGITTSSDVCVLSLFGTVDSDVYLLGDAFLRSAYVVYDLDQGQIALAQSSYNTGSNITTIGSGLYGIPEGVYNTSSPGASNVAAVPSATRTVTLASNPVPRSTLGGSGTLTFTVSGTTGITRAGTGTTTGTGAPAAASTRATSSADRGHIFTHGPVLLAGLCAFMVGVLFS